MKEVKLDQFLDAVADAEKTLCIDVRTRTEYEAGAIPGVRNIPLDALPDFLHVFNDYTDVYVHCKTGARAHLATEWLEVNTDCKVFLYSGGYKEWLEHTT